MNKSILVVEDSPTIAESYKKALETGGFSVSVAVDGLQALKKAREIQPDLIVLDVMLPKMQGFQVCRLLKFDERYSKIKIIMITGKSEERDKLIGLKTGADEYLVKPVSPEKLMEVVKTYLGK